MSTHAARAGSELVDVLVVDDSRTVRRAWSEVLAAEHGFRVRTAEDAPAAARAFGERVPGVLVLDVCLPGMDGITLLQRIMAQRPVPTLVCSALTAEQSPTAQRAFAAGALEVIGKPRLIGAENDSGQRLRDLVRGIAGARVARRGGRDRTPPLSQPRRAAAPTIAASAARRAPLIAIGASTGGTEALASILAELPGDLPPVAIVQHMPREFTPGFARRLDQGSAARVSEASDGAELAAGEVALAPGGRHLHVERRGFGGYRLRVSDGEPVNRHRPSIDVLMASVAAAAGPAGCGLVLTGMGADGARGLLAMRRAGAATAAEDEATAVVYGMPRVAVELGAAGHRLRLDEVAAWLVAWAGAIARVRDPARRAGRPRA